MRGDIYTWQRCRCGGEWERIVNPVTKRTINVVCGNCHGAPELWGVDARSFKNRKGSVGRVTRDKNDDPIYSPHHATRILESISADWDAVGKERFDPTKHSKQGRASYKLSECAAEWMLFLEEKGRQGKRGGSAQYRRNAEKAFRLHVNPFVLPDGRTLGDIDIREISPDDIERLYINMGKTLGQVSASTYLSRLMTVFKRYRDRKTVLNRIPIFPEGWSESPDREVRAINRADQRVLIVRMVLSYEKTERRAVLRALKTQVATGCRPGEVCAFMGRDRMDDGRLVVQGSINSLDGLWKETKTGKRRFTDPLPEKLAVELRSLPVLPKGFLFAKADGKPFNPNRLSDRFGDVRGPEYGDVTLNTFARHAQATITAREWREEGYREAARKLGNTVPMAKRKYVQEG